MGVWLGMSHASKPLAFLLGRGDTAGYIVLYNTCSVWRRYSISGGFTQGYDKELSNEL